MNVSMTESGRIHPSNEDQISRISEVVLGHSGDGLLIHTTGGGRGPGLNDGEAWAQDVVQMTDFVKSRVRPGFEG